MACSSGCPTPGLHESWGDCIKAKHIDTSSSAARSANRAIYTASDMYRDARLAGLQPEGVSKREVELAYRASDILGRPYRADETPTAENTVRVSSK